eukprot:jgi/Mesen1/756/ME000110S_11024
MFSGNHGDVRGNVPPNARDSSGDAHFMPMRADHVLGWVDPRAHLDARSPYGRDVRLDRDRGERITGKRSWTDRGGGYARGSTPLIGANNLEPPFKRRPPGVVVGGGRPYHGGDNGRYGPPGIRGADAGPVLGAGLPSENAPLLRKFSRDPYMGRGGMNGTPYPGGIGSDFRPKDQGERRPFVREPFTGSLDDRNAPPTLETGAQGGYHGHTFSPGENVWERDRLGRVKEGGISSWDVPPREREHRDRERFKMEGGHRMGNFNDSPYNTASQEGTQDWGAGEKEPEGRVERYGGRDGREMKEPGREGGGDTWRPDSNGGSEAEEPLASLGRGRWRSLAAGREKQAGSGSSTPGGGSGAWGPSAGVSPSGPASGAGAPGEASACAAAASEDPSAWNSQKLKAAPPAGPAFAARSEGGGHSSPPKRPRLGWGQGLAKYEKKKDVEPSSSAPLYGMAPERDRERDRSYSCRNGQLLSPGASWADSRPASPSASAPNGSGGATCGAPHGASQGEEGPYSVPGGPLFVTSNSVSSAQPPSATALPCPEPKPHITVDMPAMSAAAVKDDRSLRHRLSPLSMGSPRSPSVFASAASRLSSPSKPATSPGRVSSPVYTKSSSPSCRRAPHSVNESHMSRSSKAQTTAAPSSVLPHMSAVGHEDLVNGPGLLAMDLQSVPSGNGSLLGEGPGPVEIDRLAGTSQEKGFAAATDAAASTAQGSGPASSGGGGQDAPKATSSSGGHFKDGSSGGWDTSHSAGAGPVVLSDVLRPLSAPEAHPDLLSALSPRTPASPIQAKVGHACNSGSPEAAASTAAFPGGITGSSRKFDDPNPDVQLRKEVHFEKGESRGQAVGSEPPAKAPPAAALSCLPHPKPSPDNAVGSKGAEGDRAEEVEADAAAEIAVLASAAKVPSPEEDMDVEMEVDAEAEGEAEAEAALEAVSGVSPNKPALGAGTDQVEGASTAASAAPPAPPSLPQPQLQGSSAADEARDFDDLGVEAPGPHAGVPHGVHKGQVVGDEARPEGLPSVVLPVLNPIAELEGEGSEGEANGEVRGKGEGPLAEQMSKYVGQASVAEPECAPAGSLSLTSVAEAAAHARAVVEETEPGELVEQAHGLGPDGSGDYGGGLVAAAGLAASELLLESPLSSLEAAEAPSERHKSEGKESPSMLPKVQGLDADAGAGVGAGTADVDEEEGEDRLAVASSPVFPTGGGPSSLSASAREGSRGGDVCSDPAAAKDAKLEEEMAE